MKNRRQILMVFGFTLLLLSISCQAQSGGENQSVPPTKGVIMDGAKLPTPSKGEPVDSEPEESELIVYDTDFPLPEVVNNFQELGAGEDAINFQTKMSVDDAVAFYRSAFKERGLSEDKLLASVLPGSFSIVFRGDTKGPIVVQGVDLGDGVLNINMRHEDT